VESAESSTRIFQEAKDQARLSPLFSLSALPMLHLKMHASCEDFLTAKNPKIAEIKALDFFVLFAFFAVNKLPSYYALRNLKVW
jgi:hypothetical protein